MDQMGDYLREGVEALRRSDPDFGRVLTGVRGVGLMLGIEFSGKRDAFGDSLLGVLAQQKILVKIYIILILLSFFFSFLTKRIRIVAFFFGRG
jgi:acetylornithine/succinyldiaminopimelate/putrescine aminotransferase